MPTTGAGTLGPATGIGRPGAAGIGAPAVTIGMDTKGNSQMSSPLQKVGKMPELSGDRRKPELARPPRRSGPAVTR